MISAASGGTAAALKVQPILAVLTLSAALLLGGGQGALGDTAAQLLALGLLGVTFWRHRSDTEASLPAIAWLALLPLLLPLVQLLPLPADSLANIPERARLAAELGPLQLDLADRIALIPSATERALFWMLPALALFLAALQLPDHARRQLLAVFLLIAVASVVLGIAQLAGGKDSVLRFYAVTHSTEAVGLFANRNHFASQLVMALPFVLIATAWAVSERLGGRPLSPAWIAAGMLAAVLLILGIALARSRAGLVLGMLAIALSVPGMLSLRRRRGARRVMAAIIALAFLASVQFAMIGILDRLEQDPLADLRFRFAPVAVEAARAHAPVGAGLGAFVPAFQPFEGELAVATIINHAHNDYLELWLDGGWLAVWLALPLLIAFGWASRRAWRRWDGAGTHALLVRAAWIAMLMPLLHSSVDYPLRTTANLALYGLLAAFLLAPARRVIAQSTTAPATTG